MLHSSAMKVLTRMITVATLFLTSACEDPQKIARLEKQNQELQEKLKAQQTQDAARTYDISQKCSQEAKSWFNVNWPSDKDTLLLNYTNHYNKAKNRCYILVEYHSNSYTGDASWDNNISLRDVQENSKYGEFSEHHTVLASTGFKSRDTVYTCEVLGSKCKTVQEFNDLVRPYLSD